MEKLEQSLSSGKCFVWIGTDIVGFEDKEKAVEHIMRLCPEGHEVCWSLDESTWTPILKFEFKVLSQAEKEKRDIPDRWKRWGQNNRPL